jgi:cytochrome c biogenesis protein CcdA/glutaredoxin
LKLRILIILFALLLIPPALADTCIYFFYGTGCPHCAVADEYIQGLEAKYQLDVHRMNIATESELALQLYESYNVPQDVWGAVPILFIGNSYLLGDTPIINNLAAAIEACAGCCECPGTDGECSAEVSLPQLLGLAAVDAVNPCELAVLVILMTAILTRFPKEKKKALKVGLSFSAAIFIMYFIFGLLIIYGFKVITDVTQLSGSWFYILLGGIAIFLGIINIKDAIWYGGGGFVAEVPMRWRPRMKQIISGTASVKGAFVVGLIVSLFLTPCTAGPYFVAGGILSNLTLLSALPYLLIYMLVFISPMIEDVSSWRERNLKILHWIAGLILLGLGIAMVLGLI